MAGNSDGGEQGKEYNTYLTRQYKETDLDIITCKKNVIVQD